MNIVKRRIRLAIPMKSTSYPQIILKRVEARVAGEIFTHSSSLTMRVSFGLARRDDDDDDDAT